MKILLRGLVLAISALTLLACSNSKQELVIEKWVEVSAFYKERIALPPGAIIDIKLFEKNPKTGASISKAHASMTTDGQSMPYIAKLGLADTDFNPEQEYKVTAEIYDKDGILLFSNISEHDVITDADKTMKLEVEMGRVHEAE